MNVPHVLTIAYGVMGAVALFGYLPQIVAFYRNPRLCVETPLTSWALWSCQTVVFHLYAVMVNGDFMFMVNTGAFMLATLTCFGMQVYGRKRAKALGLEGRRAVVVVLTPPTPTPSEPIRPDGARNRRAA